MNKLSEHELADFLRVRKLNCITFYDNDIDPVNYYVFVRSGRAKRIISEFLQGRRLNSFYDAGRVIKVIEMQKILCRRWVNDIFQSSMSREDCVMLIMVYLDFQQKVSCWLGRNILCINGIAPDESTDTLLRYIQAHGYSMKLSGMHIDMSIRTFLQYQSKYMKPDFWEWLCTPFIYIKRKALRKIEQDFRKKNIKYIESLRKAHERTRQNFIDYIDKKFSLNGRYKILRAGNYLYGCTFMDIKFSGEHIFIKGNEINLTNSFNNELASQKKLVSLTPDEKKLFVCMKLFEDGDKRFIAYPYISGTMLSSKDRFTDSEIGRLGEFLVNVTEVLYKAQIVHRDITPSNIILTDDGIFKLIDFGCSYSGGEDILSRNNYIEAGMMKGLCGHMRYDENIIDDAASAHGTYIQCGGNPEDECALKLKALIGRSYACMK